MSSTYPVRVTGELTQQTHDEINAIKSLFDATEYILRVSGHQWNGHLVATLRRQTISRILWYNNIYQHIVDVPGVICEFGVQWGATMALLSNLRGIYEPFNHSRKILGFDTFKGFASIDPKDGAHNSTGDYCTGADHANQLQKLLADHEQLSPISHIKKHELIVGDACDTFPKWLEDNPASIIALAILDFDIYKPTKAVLSRLAERLTKGSVIVFDELSCPHFPGETIALMETLGIGNLRLKRNPHQPYCAFAVWE